MTTHRRVSDTTRRVRDNARLEEGERELDEGTQVPVTRDPDVMRFFKRVLDAGIVESGGRGVVRVGHRGCA
jgi:hypothetical protein